VTFPPAIAQFKAMKAIQISRTGGPEVLDYVDLPTPKPNPGEVLVLGNDMSGHVVAGHETSTLKVGQPVFIAGWDIGFRGGLYAEFVAVPEKDIWPLPDNIDLDAAAALSNYALAWTLLHQVARGIEPRNVLIYGASGGMGTALIDIARLAGANVIGLAGSAEKCAFVRGRQAAHAINYAAEPVVERVLAITGGRGADIIYLQSRRGKNIRRRSENDRAAWADRLLWRARRHARDRSVQGHARQYRPQSGAALLHHAHQR
jgi:NADPH2:quinone reductase